MRLTLLDGPAAEPLALDDAKAHLRIDGDAEDALLASLIATSRMHIEAALGLALITQTWRWQADCWPSGGVVELMTRPVQSVERIAVFDAAGVETLVDGGDYLLDRGGVSARLSSKSGCWPNPGQRLAGIEIDFTAGYGSDSADVPEPIRQAVRLLVAHWYEVRNPVNIGAPATDVPQTVSALLMPYKVHRL